MLITKEYAQCKDCKVVSKYDFSIYGCLQICFACDSEKLGLITVLEVEVNS